MDETGGPVAGYQLRYKETSAADQTATTPGNPSTGWVTSTPSGTTTSAEITGLTNGTAYHVQVRGDGRPDRVGQWLRLLVFLADRHGRDHRRQPVRPDGVEQHEQHGHVHVADAVALDLLGVHHVLHGDGRQFRHPREAHPDGERFGRECEGRQGDEPDGGRQRLGERSDPAGRGLERHQRGGHRRRRDHDEDLHRDGDAPCRGLALGFAHHRDGGVLGDGDGDAVGCAFEQREHPADGLHGHPNTAESGDVGTPPSINIPAGQTTGTGTIMTNDDGETDLDDETFTVSLGTLPSSVSAGSPSSVTVTIIDDDRRIRVSLSPTAVRVDEGRRFSLELVFSRLPDETHGWIPW